MYSTKLWSRGLDWCSCPKVVLSDSMLRLGNSSWKMIWVRMASSPSSLSQGGSLPPREWFCCTKNWPFDQPVLLRVQEDQGKAEGLVCGQWSQGPRGAQCLSDILIMMSSWVCCRSLAVGYCLKYRVHWWFYLASFLSQLDQSCSHHFNRACFSK